MTNAARKLLELARNIERRIGDKAPAFRATMARCGLRTEDIPIDCLGELIDAVVRGESDDKIKDIVRRANESD